MQQKYPNTTLIIAEAGVNHNGDLKSALKLVAAAADAGAGVVKFQTFKAKRLCTDKTPLAGYQERTGHASQMEMLRALELSRNDHEQIMRACKEYNIDFLSSPFDTQSAEMLSELGMDTFKIPSGEIENLPLLRTVAKLARRIILSTGMSTMGEVDAAVDALTQKGFSLEQLSILHCTSAYPAPFHGVNLRAMHALRKRFPHCEIGFSDHTPGIEIPVAAVALGAKVIEKHLTLDRTLPGPDHAASLAPEQFKEMVRCIQNIEQALGDGVKRPDECERNTAQAARKVLVAACPIKKGAAFTPDNVTAKRTGRPGISPMRWDWIMTRNASRQYDIDDIIETMESAT